LKRSIERLPAFIQMRTRLRPFQQQPRRK
jgi:hypothetical protein